jgi:diguanylate cyclase (GGDEF)-like protein
VLLRAEWLALLENLISISTLMICTFLSTSVVGIFMLQVWWHDRRHAMAGYWCLSMWVGSLCTLLLSMRAIGYPLITVGLGNALACLGYAFMWAGFRVFDRRPVYFSLFAAGPLVWCAAYLLVPQVADDVNNRIIVTSIIITAYSIGMGVDVWRGQRQEALPTRRIAAFFFVTHGVVYSLRIPLAIMAPAILLHGTAYSPWFAIFTLELFAHTLLAAVAMLVLIKERGESNYRIASRTDALTGIANRGSFLEDVQTTLTRNPTSGTLLIFDLDRFKAINDTYGHLAGDAVLKRFSARISSWLEEGMIFGRFGGEEFALFAPRFDIAAGERFAEVLRREVAAMSVTFEEQSIGVSVSIGLADVAGHGGDFDRLIGAADSALYAAKADGRNRVVCAAAGDLAGMAHRMRSAVKDITPVGLANAQLSTG